MSPSNFGQKSNFTKMMPNDDASFNSSNSSQTPCDLALIPNDAAQIADFDVIIKIVLGSNPNGGNKRIKR